MTYTPEERRAYIRGTLSACMHVKATTDVIAKVCADLCIASEELEEIADEDKHKSLCEEKKK